MPARRRSRSTAFADATVRHQIYLQRYSTGVVRRMLALLNRTDKELVARIQELADTATAQRLQLILDASRGLNERLNTALNEGVTTNISQLAAYEVEFVKHAGNAALGVSFAGPTLEQVRAAALARPFAGVHLAWANIGDQMTEYGRRRAALVRDTIRRSFLEGTGVDDVVRRLRGTRQLQYRDGLLESSRRTAETIVRTAMNHTATAAREEVYKLSAHQITGVRWTSVLDGRTSAICRARDGKIYPVDEGPRPPAHPNCRSTTVPIFKGDDDPDMPSYGAWLKDQPKTFVEEVLGEKKAALFLDGDLSLARFVDTSGREYSLDELRKRDRSAFEKAGIEV